MEKRNKQNLISKRIGSTSSLETRLFSFYVKKYENAMQYTKRYLTMKIASRQTASGGYEEAVSRSLSRISFNVPLSKFRFAVVKTFPMLKIVRATRYESGIIQRWKWRVSPSPRRENGRQGGKGRGETKRFLCPPLAAVT